MRDVRVATAMMQSVVGDKKGNLDRVREMAVEASAVGAEILVLPEASLTGYTVRESMAPLAETVPGPLTRALIDIAGEFSLVIVAGLVEKGYKDRMYLTQVMVGPRGLIGFYRKTHLGPTEKLHFTPGSELPIIEYQGVRYGIQLCYEGHFPEISLTMALKGAEVILMPHASPRESPVSKLGRWLRYLPARSYDNTLYLVAVNQVGDNGAGLEFAGVAVILGPKGEILTQAAGRESGLIYADLTGGDLVTIKEGRMGFFLPLRRPGLYNSI